MPIRDAFGRFTRARDEADSGRGSGLAGVFTPEVVEETAQDRARAMLPEERRAASAPVAEGSRAALDAYNRGYRRALADLRAMGVATVYEPGDVGGGRVGFLRDDGQAATRLPWQQPDRAITITFTLAEGGGGWSGASRGVHGGGGGDGGGWWDDALVPAPVPAPELTPVTQRRRVLDMTAVATETGSEPEEGSGG